VYLYSKTGQMKRALYLIIDRLGDVSRAIAFAKEQDDPDLWEDLLEYSMDKPRFIRGLLEEVGTAINPIKLVRRIPEGLEVEGLREGLKHIMKEHEIQYSISSGVARVLRSEVAAAQNLLRGGQRKGVKFEVAVHTPHHVDVQAKDVATTASASASAAVAAVVADSQRKKSTASQGGKKKEGGGGGDDDGESDVVSLVNGHGARAAKKWEPGHCAHCLEPFDEWQTETMVGFACGHVFHLPHLLEVLQPGRAVDEDVLLGVMAEQRSHLIGAKVTHARLLRDRIRGGCPVCKQKKEAEY